MVALNSLGERIDRSTTTKAYPFANVEVQTRAAKIDQRFGRIVAGTLGRT
jgi:hypothetical protein